MTLKEALLAIYFTERVEIFDHEDIIIATGRCEDVAQHVEQYKNTKVLMIETGIENSYGDLHAVIFITLDKKEGEE